MTLRSQERSAYDELWIARVTARSTIIPGGCWLWNGFIFKNGYGGTSYRSKNVRLHRKALEIFKGPIPAGHDACHTCDVRNCWNPEHLWSGTRKQNLHDMLAKGRHMHQVVTHCPKGHAYAEHGYHRSGRTNTHWRACRLCDRAAHQTPEHAEWRRAYQRMRRGWTKEEAYGTPLVQPGQRTARRSVGARK